MPPRLPVSAFRSLTRPLPVSARIYALPTATATVTAAAIFPFSLFSTSKPDMTEYKINKSESEWRAELSPEQVGVEPKFEEQC